MHCNYYEISRIDNVITYKYNKISAATRTDNVQIYYKFKNCTDPMDGWMDGS